MTSRKQIETNRANARLSTGPKTKCGKGRSKVNALTHGQAAEKIVAEGEQAAVFETFRNWILGDLRPRGAVSQVLAGMAVVQLWRLRQLPEAEAKALSEVMRRPSEFEVELLTDDELNQLLALCKKLEVGSEDTRSDLTDQEGDHSHKGRGGPRGAEMLTLLARYETSKLNNLNKTLRLFFALQGAEEELGNRPPTSAKG